MKRKCLIPLAVFIAILCGCAPRVERAEASLFAMDTYCSVEAHGTNATAAVAAAAKELERLEALLSITGSGSDVSRINAADGALLPVSADTFAIVETANRVSEATGGAFDITIEPIVRIWGFYDSEWRVPPQSEIDRALPAVDYTRLAYDAVDMTLQLGQDQRIDLGGIGKGYASDRLAQMFAEFGVDGALISLGGNVHALGARPDGGDWRIGIRDPLDETGVLAVVELRDRAVITAGSYQRYFEAEGMRYHHIMDPFSGRPAESGLLSVTVIAENGAYADALSTALFVMGKDQAIALWARLGDFDMLLVDGNGAVYYTKGIRITEHSVWHNFVEIVE